MEVCDLQYVVSGVLHATVYAACCMQQYAVSVSWADQIRATYRRQSTVAKTASQRTRAPSSNSGPDESIYKTDMVYGGVDVDLYENFRTVDSENRYSSYNNKFKKKTKRLEKYSPNFENSITLDSLFIKGFFKT